MQRTQSISPVKRCHRPKAHRPSPHDIQTSLPIHNLFPTVEELALACFTTNFSTWLRHLDPAQRIHNQGNVGKHLLVSMSAVGLASFSNTMHAPELMARARAQYVSALQLTNAALKSPTDVLEDSTLSSVMVLSVFETVTGSNAQSFEHWQEHINGAAALVEVRGVEQLKTPAGLRMFLQVTFNLMLGCAIRAVAMPEHIIKFRKKAELFIDASDPMWQLTGIVIDCTNFFADVRKSKIVDPRPTIERALNIDGMLSAMFEDPPEEWLYKTVHTDECPDLIWNGKYHVYKDVQSAHAWSRMGTCRILIQEVILKQLLIARNQVPPVFTEVECRAQKDSTVNILLKVRDDLLASVSEISADTSHQKATSLMDESKGYFGLWPLYLVGSMDMSTQPIKDWVVARLRSVWALYGLRQALSTAYYLDGMEHVVPWYMEPEPKPDLAEPAGTLQQIT